MRKLTDKEIHERWLEMPSEYRYTYRQIDRHHRIMELLSRTLAGTMVLALVLPIVPAIAQSLIFP